jgi:biopolymer transport protein ExbD
MLRTDAGAAYSQVMCVLGQLQDRGIYKVGLIASPASPLPARVTIATK